MKKRIYMMVLALCAVLTVALAACSTDNLTDHLAKGIAVDHKNDSYPLHLSATYESNLIFAKYDIGVSVDGDLVAQIAQGDAIEQTVELEKGTHAIRFEKHDADAVVTGHVYGKS